MTRNLLAFDLGAESGRAIVGHFDGNAFQLEVVHRFPNGGVRLPDGLYWNALRLFEEMKAGLRLAAGKVGRLDSLGIDTWGVDFALLGRGDVLLGNPRHYRDPHTEGIYDYAFARVPREEMFAQTGIQFMRFNSVFQLLAMQRDRSPLLDAAERLLFVPDLFHFWFTGEKANEYTDASTSQCLDPATRTWAWPLLDRLGLPRGIFGPLVAPATKLGTVTPALADETGAGAVPVVLPGTHDTASAVAAVPAESADWCYISSGTWSLMGAEVPQPIVNEQSLRHNFTNEGGIGGTIRLLKNVMGLWLVQECRRAWERAGRTYSYDELTKLAEAAPPLVSLVDPDDASFVLPANMPAAIAAFCTKTGQPAPQEAGAVVRCALESLALRYRWVLERLESLLGRRLEVIHIVGGGSQNKLLNQLTADACNRVVVAGPVEATALGNLAVQAMGLGLLGSLADARAVVRRSFALERFEPKRPAQWAEAWQRFTKLV